MTFRERLEQEFRFQMTGNPIGRQIADWREGDAAIPVSDADELGVLKAHVVATHKTLLLLADMLDAIEIRPAEEP